MREVPVLVSPGLATVVLVVIMIEHRDHVVFLACRVCVHTRGHSSERNTMKGLATHPHSFACAVGVLIFVLGRAPTMCSPSVVQGPAAVRRVKEGVLDLILRNAVRTAMPRIGEMPTTSHENTVTITVSRVIAWREKTLFVASLLQIFGAHDSADLDLDELPAVSVPGGAMEQSVWRRSPGREAAGGKSWL